MTYTDHTKIFRAEKTTRNRDDFRVMMVGSVVAIFLILVIPVIQKLYDDILASRPFITATVEVIQTDDYERPMILYDADAKQPADADWVAIVRDEKGNRLSSRRGEGSYSVKEDNPRLWTWAAFFDDEKGTVPPAVPRGPFQICLRYISVARDSGSQDETPERCSKVFYPEDNETSIEDPVTVEDIQ